MINCVAMLADDCDGRTVSPRVMIGPKLIYVVGVCHEMQSERPSNGPLARQDIDNYKREIEIVNNKYRFALFCEEIGQQDFSVLERFAIDRRKRYVNINMPMDIRAKLNIPKDYATNKAYAPDQVLVWHELREEFMFERATDRMQKDTVSLIVCGDEHRGRLANRFRQLGGKVEEESFRDKPWFRRVIDE